MEDLVKNENGHVATNSLLVANKFEKEHKNVIRDIEALKKDVLNFELMFLESTYLDTYGREQKMFIMNRDGFTLLAVGFTGKKALKFKLEYISAFNEMEAKLKEISKPLSQLELMQHSIDLLVSHEKKLIEQKEQLTEHDERILKLEAKTTTRPDFFTIAGYGSLIGQSVNVHQAKLLGQKASKICKDRNIQTDSTPDPRFGTVKTYPTEILKEVFGK